MHKISITVLLTAICILMAGSGLAIDPATVETGHVWLLDEVA